MLLIACPWCGERQEVEFHCGGEAHIARPAQPATLSDAEWADYLFMRSNPKGLHLERWSHVHGCGRWFNLARETLGERIVVVYRMGEAPPTIQATDASPTAAPASAPATATPAEPTGAPAAIDGDPAP